LHREPDTVGENDTTISPGTRMKAAFALAILADLVQLIVFPLFIEGAASPTDDLLDLAMAGLMTLLLGWHWEFLPSFLGKLVPGVDFVPLWTLAVANVYRKSRQIEKEPEGKVIEGEPVRKSEKDK
jgi:hypothetical protein